MVDGAHARAQPDGQGGRGAEVGAEDDEARADGGVLEGVFVLGVVVGGAGQGRVLARGERSGDADDRDRCGEERVAEGGAVEVERFQALFGRSVVGERERDDFRRVGQAAAAERDEDVRVGGFGFGDDREDLGVVGVGFDALCDADDGVGAEGGFEGGDEGGEGVGGAAEGAGGEDVGTAGMKGGVDVVGAGGGVGGAVRDVGGGMGSFVGEKGGGVGFV